MLIHEAATSPLPLPVLSTHIRTVRLQVMADVVPGELAEAVMQAVSLPSGIYDVMPGEGLRSAARPQYTHGGMFDIANQTHKARSEKTPRNIDVTGHGEINRRLTEIIRQLLKLESTVGIIDGGLGATQGWDSMKQIEIVLAAEGAFGVRFQTSEINALKRFQDLATRIAEKLGAK